ncbi:hypothetical protein SK128_023812, partial [Halocaridina rubra]
MNEPHSAGTSAKQINHVLPGRAGSCSPGQRGRPAGYSYCSSKFQQYLRRIKKMHSRGGSSSCDGSSMPTSSSSGSDESSDERKAWKPKAALLKEVRNGKRDIETVCIACDKVDCKIAAPHPFFLGGTCESCK